MKTHIRLVICLGLLIVSSSAQIDYPATIEDITGAQMADLLKSTAQVPAGPEKVRKLIHQALTKKRLDLIREFFISTRANHDLVEAVGSLPEGEFRQKLTILMLRTPTRAFWRWEPPPITISGGIDQIGANVHKLEPFASIPKILPTVGDLPARLQTQAERLKLADDLEEALLKNVGQKAGIDSLPEKAETTKIQRVPPIELRPVGTISDHHQPRLPPERSDAAKVFWRHGWWIVAAAVVALSIVLGLKRARRSL